MAASAAAPVSSGVGARATTGTGGYRAFSMSGDASWRARDLEPYFSGEFRKDSYQRQLTLGGGAWKELGTFSVKGGLALTRGRIKNSQDSAGSVTLDAGVEKPYEGFRAGAGWWLTLGSIASNRAAPGAGRRLAAGVRRRPAAAPETFHYHELAGYASLPMGPGTVYFRLSVGLPSYARAVFTEAADWTVPLTGRLSLTPGIAWEQGELSRTYYSIGARWKFR